MKNPECLGFSYYFESNSCHLRRDENTELRFGYANVVSGVLNSEREDSSTGNLTINSFEDLNWDRETGLQDVDWSRFYNASRKPKYAGDYLIKKI